MSDLVRFVEADKCVENGDSTGNLEKLKALGEPSDDDFELLFRLARAHHLYGEDKEAKEGEKRGEREREGGQRG